MRLMERNRKKVIFKRTIQQKTICLLEGKRPKAKKVGEKIVKISQVQRSKRKFTTSVVGLDAFGLDLKQSAKKMSKQFACSASVVKGGMSNPIPQPIPYPNQEAKMRPAKFKYKER